MILEKIEIADTTPQTKAKDKKVKKPHLKLGDVFAHAYDALSQAVQPKSGLALITQMTVDKEKAASKLKGKSFLLRKNTILRGKKSLTTKKGVVSRKVIREKALFEMSKVTFADALLLNKIWEDYITRIMPEERGNKTDPNRYMVLLRADYHGAWIKVVASKNHNDEGHEGIVVKETLKTFHVCTENEGVKIFLKENIIIGLRYKHDWFKILGLNIILRGDDRSKFKPKWKNPMPHLQNILPLS
jgi:RNase P/RNase MRP subunit p29